MSGVKNTPTPWELDSAKDGDGSYQIIHGQLPKGINGDFGYPVADTMNRHHCIAPEEDQANAELIVRCVNSHEELVEALKAAVQGCGCTIRERESGHLVDCFVPCAIEALAKAGRP